MATKTFIGLDSFAAFCDRFALSEPERLLQTAGAAKLILQTRIKSVFGDKARLAALSPDSTLMLREGDTPLLIDGELLRDSIESHHESYGTGAVAGVGSAEPILVAHEHGFVTSPDSMIPNKVVPPRPAFAIGVYEALPQVQEVVAALLKPGGWGTKIRTLSGQFASLSEPASLLTNVGDPANAISGE